MHHLHLFKNIKTKTHPSIPLLLIRNATSKLTFSYNTQIHQQIVMDWLEQNQATLRDEVSQVQPQIGQLMENIQAVARGQETMAKMLEEMNQHVHAANPIPTANPSLIPPTIENPAVLPQSNPPVQIGAPSSVPPVNLHPPVVKIDDQYNAFFSPWAASHYDAFGPATNEVEKKVRAIEDKLKAMESTDVLGLDVTEICLV